MFQEQLIIMDKQTQTGPAGTVVTWSDGARITAKLTISNMQSVLIAQAQGVKPTGYLVVPADADGKPKYPIELNTYLRYPRGGFYIKAADNGIVEAGEGVLKERQYAVEAMDVLPR